MPLERSAGLVIFRKEIEEPIFLLLRYHYWGFPKGNIESWETEKEAAIREAEEETGISNLRLIKNFEEKIKYFYRKRGKSISKTVVYFLAETKQKDVRLSFEHRGYMWLRFKEALSTLSYGNDRRILRKASAFLEENALLSEEKIGG
jgi:8-oxo-dGTP pyrophosphatase MutT (NUDIX family)